MQMIRILLLAIVSLAFSGCGPTPKFLTPPTGPGTDYPCGYYGVSCRPQSATCCPESYRCSDVDECEYTGSDAVNRNSRSTYGAARVKRTPEHR